MTPRTQAWLQLGAQGLEALLWLVLTLWALERLRSQGWARYAAVGAVLLLVPATTLAAARAQILIGHDDTILTSYAASALPTVYAMMRVVAAGLLLAAVVVGRGAGRPSPA